MIVIPMAGLSRRFTEAGYAVPKYRLRAGGKTVFAHCVESFAAYFASEPFLFVVRDDADAIAFVEDECRQLGVRDARVVRLDAPTRGQAETVFLGLAAVDDDTPVTIFNIDTMRPAFRFPTQPALVAAAGLLEVFVGEGANWSFVKPALDGFQRVAETSEKVPISNLCCTGLYHFARAGDFCHAFQVAVASGLPALGEFYVAPLYNTLIAAGHDIRYALIDRSAVTFSGTPDEYESFRRSIEA